MARTPYYSSQASTFTCRAILPSLRSSVLAVKTFVPSEYSHASWKATRSCPTTSPSMRWVVVAKPNDRDPESHKGRSDGLGGR